MDLEDIKAKIAELKDKTVDNVDKHFNDEILLDIFDSGELEIIDKPLDDFDWYLYWKLQAYDLREIFYVLFNKKQNKTTKNLLYECLELKKEIDKNLLSNPHYDYDDLMEWFGVSEKDKISDKYIPLTNNDSINSKILETLYRFLTEGGFIQTKFETFRSHFYSNSTITERIKWIGTEIQIIALIDSMLSNNIIPKRLERRLSFFITNHFLNRFGNDFNAKQLVIVKSNLIRERKKLQDIYQMADELVKINKNHTN